MTEHATDHAPEQATDPQRPQSGFASALRTLAIWTLVFMVAIVAAFGAGYFLKEREMLDLRQQLVEQRAEAAAEVAVLNRRVVEAEKTQLEQDLKRATLQINLSKVLAPLPVALAELERKNFGNAMERIATARRALEAPGIGDAVREVASARLDALSNDIVAELARLASAEMKNRIATGAEALERLLVARYDATPFLTVTGAPAPLVGEGPRHVWEAPTVSTPMDRAVLDVEESFSFGQRQPAVGESASPIMTDTVEVPSVFPATPPLWNTAPVGETPVAAAPTISDDSEVEPETVAPAGASTRETDPWTITPASEWDWWTEQPRAEPAPGIVADPFDTPAEPTADPRWLDEPLSDVPADTDTPVEIEGAAESDMTLVGPPAPETPTAPERTPDETFTWPRVPPAEPPG